MSYEAELGSHYASVRERLFSPAKRVALPASPPARPYRPPSFDPTVMWAKRFERWQEKHPNGPTPISVSEPSTLDPPAENPFLWEQIIKEVCEKHGLRRKEITSNRRGREIVRARHEAFYRMAHETTLSFAAIGRKVGDFDHTTVIHGIKQHGKRIAEQGA